MKSVLVGLILASLALAQYPKAGGYAPLTGARNIQTGTTLVPPKTTGCVPGDIYFATDATPGQQLYLNSATGVCNWVQQLDTTGSTGGPLTYQGGSAISIVSGTIYCPPFGSAQCSATEADVQLPSAIQGTITSIYANLSLAPGAAKSAAITWRKSGADQSSTCTISGTTTPATCNDNSDSFAISQGDLLDYKVVWTGSILVNPTLSVISALGQGASSGSVNTGVALAPAYYAAAGTAVSGAQATYIWNGIVLTGVSFGAAVITNVTFGNSATLIANASNSGKRVLFFVNVQNPTSTTATYALTKVNGSNTCKVLGTTTVTGVSNGTVSGSSTVLEPGENLSVAVTVAGQLNFVADSMLYDSTINLKSPTTYGLANGANAVYTVPTGYTALTFPRSGLAQPPAVSNTAAVFTGDTSSSLTVTLSIAGTTWYTATESSNVVAAYGLPGILSTGTAIGFNVNQASTSACFAMPTLFERLN